MIYVYKYLGENLKNLKTIKEERKKLEQHLQNEYNSKTGYIEKLEYIYNLLLKSQQHYLKYTGNTTFDENYLNKLQGDLRNLKNLNDDVFVGFIKENIMSRIKCGHIFLLPHEVKGKSSDEYLNERNINQNIEYNFMSDTLVLKIKSFHKSYYKRDEIVFNELREILHKKQIDNVIIDLRGNGGGTDQYVGYFQIFFSKSFKRTNKFKNLFTNKNGVSESIFNGFPDSKDYNIYVLIDGKCFSATDNFARFCKASGFATLVGQPTRGEGYGMNPLRIQITESEYTGKHLGVLPTIKGVEITYPIDAPINEQGEIDYENFYRTTPDIICDASDALNVALKEIEKKKTSKNEILTK